MERVRREVDRHLVVHPHEAGRSYRYHIHVKLHQSGFVEEEGGVNAFARKVLIGGGERNHGEF